MLLRAIDVATAKPVTTADLRELLDGLGSTAVRTHLASGGRSSTGTRSPSGTRASP